VIVTTSKSGQQNILIWKSFVVSNPCSIGRYCIAPRIKKACKWQDEHTSALKPLIYLLKRLLTSLSLTRYCYVFENCWRHSSDIRMARSFGCACRTGDRTRLPLRAWTRMSSRCWRHYRERHFGINHRLSQRKSLTSLLEKVHLHAESHYHCA